MIVIPESGLERLTNICIAYLGELELYGANEEMMLSDASHRLARRNTDEEIREKVRALIASIFDGDEKSG